MRTGDLAAQAGLTAKTIRFYEQAGLMPKPPRTPARYREHPLNAEPSTPDPPRHRTRVPRTRAGRPGYQVTSAPQEQATRHAGTSGGTVQFAGCQQLEQLDLAADRARYRRQRRRARPASGCPRHWNKGSG